MSVQLLILILIFLAAVSFLGFIWQVYKLRAVKSKGRRRESSNGKIRRDTDRRALSSNDKKIFSQAQDLLNGGRPTQAAQLLESIHLQREAITILENAGLIPEAARILMRMGRPNRAGVIYARHRYWEKAAECFKTADMPLEVAKCAKEGGNLPLAAEYYIKAGKLAEAGRIFMELGDHRQAAKYLGEGGDIEVAITEYKKFLYENTSNSLSFDTGELKVLASWLAGDNFDREIVRVVVSTSRAKELLTTFAKQNRLEEAAQALQVAPENISGMLLSDLDYENPLLWENLAKIFILNGDFSNAGVIFEKKGLFERAGLAFEKGDNAIRAIYCYERAGLSEKVAAMRGEPRTPDRDMPRNLPNIGNKTFSMQVVTEYRNSMNQAITDAIGNDQGRSAEVEFEHTAIIDSSSSPPPLTPRNMGFKSVFAEDYSPEPSEYLEEDDEAVEDDDNDSSEVGSDGKEEASIDLYAGAPNLQAPRGRSGVDRGLDDPVKTAVKIPPVPLRSSPTLSLSDNVAANSNPKSEVIMDPVTLDLSDENSDGDLPTPPKMANMPPYFDQKSVGVNEGLREVVSAFPQSSEAIYKGFIVGTDTVDAQTLELDGLDDVAATVGFEDLVDISRVPHQAFTRASFISDLSAKELAMLWAAGEVANYAHGEVILEAQDTPLGVYIILEGSVDCYKLSGATEQFLDTMGPADTFGELWLLSGQPSAIKFICRNHCLLRLIRSDNFNHVLDREGLIARKIYKKFTARLLSRILKPQDAKKVSKAI